MTDPANDTAAPSPRKPTVPLVFLVASLRAELDDLANALPRGSDAFRSVGRCLLLVTELEKHDT